MHLYEKQLSSKIIHEGKIITVTEDIVELENGCEAVREVVHHSGGVCVLALTDENEIIFVNQFRYPFEDVLLEIPAGKLNASEDPLECGKRELKEETGVAAAEYIFLGEMYPTTAYLTERIHIYLARGLDFSSQNLDEDEFLDVVRIPFEKAVEMIINNEIPDAKTQVAILKAKMILQK